MAKIHQLSPSAAPKPDATAELELRTRDLVDLTNAYAGRGYDFTFDLFEGFTVVGNGLHATWPTAAKIEEQIADYEAAKADRPVTVRKAKPSTDVPLPAPPSVEIEVEAPDAASLLPVPAKVVPVEVVARERVAAQGHDAYDAETGEWIKVSATMVEQEQQMREAFAVGKLLQAVVVREVFDRKLYLAAGCETREEYAETVLGVSRRTAYNYHRLASRMSQVLPMPDVAQLATGGVQTLHSPDSETAEIVQSTSISTLYEMVKLPDDDLDTLLDGSALTLADGRTISVEDFKRASARESKQIVKDLKAQYKSKLANDQERAATAETERDIYRERLEAAETTITTLRDGERTWGPRQAHTEAQMAAMESAEKHIKALGLALDQLNPDVPGGEPPAALCRAAGTLLHRLENHVQSARDQLAPLTMHL